MIRQHFIVGTAGHIDHGKSSLVRALTGIDPDRLPEEKARGMTIDLGFSHLALQDPEDAEREFRLGIVDVPGHADFVKNMVAGVGSIDLALLVVAADDGWMPQTEEHVQILTYLGVRRAVVALTKTDVADAVLAAEMVREALKGTPFADAPLVPTAAPQGRGIPELKRMLATVLRETPPPRDFGRPRLAVDRVFSPAGIGTVVTGTLTGGVLQKNQPVVLQPPGIHSHLRNLQSHGADVKTALPGTRTALQLADVAVDARSKKRGARRGDVVTLPCLGAPVMALHVQLEKTPRNLFAAKAAERPLRHGQDLTWHHGSGAHEVRVRLLAARTLVPGGRCLAELKFTEPVHAFAGDRFILRDLAKQATVAGGIVLDADPAPGSLRKPGQVAMLELRASEPDNVAAFVLSGVSRQGAVLREGLLAKSHFSEDEIRSTIGDLAAANRIIAGGSWLLDTAWWEQKLAVASEMLRNHHLANPQAMGMDVAELSNLVAPHLPDRRLFDVLVSGLAAVGFVRAGKVIRSASHHPGLPPQLQEAGAAIRSALAASPLEPPNVGELAPTPAHRQALTFLLETGEAVRLDEKTIISAEALAGLKAAILSHLQRAGTATASDLRQATATTRRILIPLLEKLDREGFTRRQGDLRSIGRNAVPG